jgi:N-acetylmuramoyl-L-alanine amidase
MSIIGDLFGSVKSVHKQKYVWLLDNGHGGIINGVYQTEGKRSPVWEDGSQLFEGEFNRDVVNKLVELLKKEGIAYKVVVPEQEDISLKERVRRVNNYHTDLEKGCVLVSVHGNAGGGTGYEVYTSVGTTRSDAIATEFYNATKNRFPNMRMRPDVGDGDPDKEAQFYILKHTMCPALLTENFFMDTYNPDCKLMLSEEGRQKIAQAHFDAILKVELSDKL